jgi:hypothetical protein
MFMPVGIIGACIDEHRRILIPPTLGHGASTIKPCPCMVVVKHGNKQQTQGNKQQHRKIVDFYTTHDPKRIPNVDLMINKYTFTGLIDHLRSTYHAVPLNWESVVSAPCTTQFKLPNCFDRELPAESWMLADLTLTSWQPGTLDENVKTQTELYNDEEARGTETR